MGGQRFCAKMLNTSGSKILHKNVRGARISLKKLGCQRFWGSTIFLNKSGVKDFAQNIFFGGGVNDFSKNFGGSNILHKNV